MLVRPPAGEANKQKIEDISVAVDMRALPAHDAQVMAWPWLSAMAWRRTHARLSQVNHGDAGEEVHHVRLLTRFHAEPSPVDPPLL